MRASTTRRDQLEDRIALLETATRVELIEAWTKLYKTPPFKGMRNQTLLRGIAYQIQVKAMGGLTPAISKQLVRIATGEDVPVLNAKRRHRLMLGSKLIREWNGRSYEVDVLDKGFQLNGETYASLSAIAKSITGAHWSGPRFFGVHQ